MLVITDLTYRIGRRLLLDHATVTVPAGLIQLPTNESAAAALRRAAAARWLGVRGGEARGTGITPKKNEKKRHSI